MINTRYCIMVGFWPIYMGSPQEVVDNNNAKRKPVRCQRPLGGSEINLCPSATHHSDKHPLEVFEARPAGQLGAEAHLLNTAEGKLPRVSASRGRSVLAR